MGVQTPSATIEQCPYNINVFQLIIYIYYLDRVFFGFRFFVSIASTSEKGGPVNSIDALNGLTIHYKVSML